MQREQLLNLLDQQARDAFEGAKQIALANGGLVTPLHVMVSLLKSSGLENAEEELLSLFQAASEAIKTRYPEPSKSITISRETQTAISEAGRLAQLDGCVRATPVHLMRASARSQTVKEALGDVTGLEQIASLIADKRSQESSGEKHLVGEREGQAAGPATQPADRSSRPVRALTGALSDYCSDVAEESRASSSHPFVGREREITAVLETLCRKLKSNPLLIGKPGVGKTALVVAVASRLWGGDVPRRLRGKRILEVSRLRLLADAKFAGETEERLKKLLEEVRRAGDVILFFDEIHTLLSAGGAGGTGDIANLLKSSLSKGEIICIGATTLAEYYKYIARDEALARRFSTITIEEPSPDETRRILLETRSAFESYHGLKIDDVIIAQIVEMADRYLQSRSFPDKAFDLLDKAAAKATIAGHPHLTRECLTETLSETTGLPLEMMDEDPSERLERLEEVLNSAVPGQQRASRDVARVVRIAKLGLEIRPEQPDGVFLFVGPEGVGKHEMATALAKFLYGSGQKMIDFDMSQFTEVWSISRLIGAEPGYVGYSDRSGLLSKAAEDNPHSVLYFRNIDLAHTIVQQFLGEAFEQGRFTDATGARISLSNTTVVMSLSQITETTKHSQMGFVHNGDSEERRLSGELRRTGSLHLRERGAGFGINESLAATVDEVIEFQVLDREATERIIAERLEALGARLAASQPVVISMRPELAAFFAERLTSERKSLAQLERLLQETIIIPFTNLHLDRRAVGARPEVVISIENQMVRIRV
ncbi:MAG TPA: ATP-dependent Clp protease ATP-binding subunit [Blastocatellia bacterium]|nr:ATP-dependent Clp protease ATP-binding subunit [Blastocatellia bacterium]